MTEKRFFITNGKHMVLEYEFYNGKNRLSPLEVIDLLNEQNKEIRNYEKSQKEALELIREQRKFIDELYKENEQLKQSNNKVIELILDGVVEMHDGKRDYAETIFNKTIKLLKGD